MTPDIERRRTLQAIGVGTTLALAGCVSDDDSADDDAGNDESADEETNGAQKANGSEQTNGEDGEDETDRTPEEIVVDWASEAANFDSADDIVDYTGEETVCIDNGIQVDGNYTYEPAVVRITEGTTVTWEWVSENHSVTPESDEGATTTEYGTDNDVFDSGHEQTDTFEEAGVGLYFCNPHRAIHGQVGAVIVEEA